MNACEVKHLQGGLQTPGKTQIRLGLRAMVDLRGNQVIISVGLNLIEFLI